MIEPGDTTRSSAPLYTLPRSRYRRFVDDLVLTILVSTSAGVLVDVIFGKPAELYSQAMYSLTVGIVALVIVDVARLLVWDDPVRRRRWLLPLSMIAVASAPVGHYCALIVGDFILAERWPRHAMPLVWPVHMVLFALLSVGVTMFLILNRERVERITAERAEARAHAGAVERQALLGQLRLQQAQIEPHMLFNALANLQALVVSDPRMARQMLDHLIRFLRANLTATRHDHIALAQEFDAIDAYLGVMKIRMGERLRYQCVLPDALRAVRLPPMLLQPLVENAIIHGLEPKIDGGEIVIRAAIRAGALCLTIADTGLGFAVEEPCDATDEEAVHRGIGMDTTRERLRVLYGARAGLVLVPDQADGALVQLTLPLEFI